MERMKGTEGTEVEGEKDQRKPTLVKLEEYEKRHQKSRLARLEDYAIGFLYSFIERDASTWGFWIKITVVMFIVTAGPMFAIQLFFLGRDHGFFD